MRVERKKNKICYFNIDKLKKIYISRMRLTEFMVILQRILTLRVKNETTFVEDISNVKLILQSLLENC